MWSLSFVLCFYSTIYYCYSEEQRQSDDQYSMNEKFNAPPWPLWLTSNANGKMFAVPTQLEKNDGIIITGDMADGVLDIALIPVGKTLNAASQINIDKAHNLITLRNGGKIIGNFEAQQYFRDDDTSIDVSFIITSNTIRISINGGFLEVVPLEDIRIISVQGPVKEMNFKFKAFDELID